MGWLLSDREAKWTGCNGKQANLEAKSVGYIRTERTKRLVIMG